ncbi:kinase-like domain-containing protein [Aspergillus venezuelensis]
MAIPRQLPDLVKDTKIAVKLYDLYAVHLQIESGSYDGPRARRTWRRETWTRTKLLGGGATGEVWLEECHTGAKKGQLQAVKVISKSIDFDVYEELETIAKFSQSTSKYEGLFVKSVGWYEDKQSVFIVMEHIKHGSLAAHLTRPLPEDEASQIVLQILEGLACLHESEFVHRDLKPHNILVASQGPRWWVKIGDFGFSKRVNGDASLHSFVGTMKYLAPEVLRLNPHSVSQGVEAAGAEYRCTYAVDMWSLGITAYFMLFHEYPYQDRSLLEYLKGNHLSEVPLSEACISRELCSFIRSLLTVDPRGRMSATAALVHPWLQMFGDDSPSISWGNQHATLSEQRTTFTSSTGPSASWSLDGTWTSRAPLNDLSTIPGEKALDNLRILHQNCLRLIAAKEYIKAEEVFQEVANARKEGRHNNAQRTLQFVADVQTESLGSTHRHTLASNYWLTSSLLEQGKFDAAQEAADATVGVDYSCTAEVHRSLAQCLYKLKRYREAGPILDKALQFTSPAPEIAESMGLLFDIGRALHKVGQYGGAQRCFERVSDYSRDLFGPAHEKTIDTTIYLASALGHQSGKATDVLGVLLNMPLSTFNSESVFSRLQDVGEILWQQKAYSEAHTALISASWLGRSLLGLAQYEEAATVLYSTIQDQLSIKFAGELGRVQRRHGDATEIIRSSKTDQVDPCKCKEAISYARLTYPIFNRNLGDSHKDTIISLRFQGSAEGQMGWHSLAEESLRRSLYFGSKLLAPEDEEFIRIRIDYGIALYGIGCFARALDHLHFGHDHQVATLGATHEETLDTLSCTGSAQYELSLPKESAKSWKQSLAFALALGGIWGEAVSLLELVLRARDETLGPEHPKTIESRKTVQKGRKLMMGGKWMLWSFWPKRRELDCRHL